MPADQRWMHRLLRTSAAAAAAAVLAAVAVVLVAPVAEAAAAPDVLLDETFGAQTTPANFGSPPEPR